jgi:hypothetical protein
MIQTIHPLDLAMLEFQELVSPAYVENTRPHLRLPTKPAANQQPVKRKKTTSFLIEDILGNRNEIYLSCPITSDGKDEANLKQNDEHSQLSENKSIPLASIQINTLTSDNDKGKKDQKIVLFEF